MTWPPTSKRQFISICQVGQSCASTLDIGIATKAQSPMASAPGCRKLSISMRPATLLNVGTLKQNPTVSSTNSFHTPRNRDIQGLLTGQQYTLQYPCLPLCQKRLLLQIQSSLATRSY